MASMTRRQALGGAALALAALVPGVPARAQAGGPARVVFQVSDGDPKRWNLALNNIRNVGEELGPGVEIELVAYGPGIGMLKADSEVGNRVADAVKAGVKVVACRNTMKAQKLVDADMLPTIGYVPAGVVELMKRQSEGWAYIRP